MKINGVQYYSNAQNRAQQNKQTFEARFDKASLKLLLDETSQIKTKKPEIIPQLYTMLDYVSELPGKMVKIVDELKGKNSEDVLKPMSRSFVVDGKDVLITKNGNWMITKRNNIKKFEPSAIGMLERVCLLDDSSSYSHVRMPKSVFEQTWWKNRGVREETIVNRF